MRVICRGGLVTDGEKRLVADREQQLVAALEKIANGGREVEWLVALEKITNGSSGTGCVTWAADRSPVPKIASLAEGRKAGRWIIRQSRSSERRNSLGMSWCDGMKQPRLMVCPGKPSPFDSYSIVSFASSSSNPSL
ncbi:hypothetical protein KSP39_PZI019385 [Platanthera zijinensis]|uniref:Uncharacterized protein n=1 Tax=Platanthera zijinensis TaxID=2320716 RepID=A0AAP0FY86_9ASPA